MDMEEYNALTGMLHIIKSKASRKRLQEAIEEMTVCSNIDEITTKVKSTQPLS
jgi:hypothetical protein